MTASQLYLQTPQSTLPLTRDWLDQWVAGYYDRASLTGVLDLQVVAQAVWNGLPTQSTLQSLEESLIEICHNRMIRDHRYDQLAARVTMERLHGETAGELEVLLPQLEDVLAPPVTQFWRRYLSELQAALLPEYDYRRSLFSLRTLEMTYYRRDMARRVLERPSTMMMRVATGIHGYADDLPRALQTYRHLMEGYYIHATPTLTNAGIEDGNLSSCFVLTVDDNLESIVRSWDHSARINSAGGGVAIYLGKLRAIGSIIHSTRKRASGLEVMQVYDRICQYIRKSSLRGSSINVAIDVWHADLFYFLDAKRPFGDESELTRKLFTQLVVCDLFMERVEAGGEWSLFCPSDVPDLPDLWGDRFREAYLRYEEQGVARRTLPAQEVYQYINSIQQVSGLPYLANKDTINGRGNFQHRGTIYCLNMCMEIAQLHTSEEYTICNLATMCLPRYVDRERGTVDYALLAEMAGEVTYNIDQIIRHNHLPLPETERTNSRDRPMAIGSQGLADVCSMLRIPYGGPQSREINRLCAEAIKFGHLRTSCDLAREHGPCESYEGSPTSQGIHQHHYWGVTPSDLFPWAELLADIEQHGLAHLVGTGYPPTASTSQIAGHHESTEPWSSNLYLRSTAVGEFYVVNRYMMEHLQELGLWDEDMIDDIKLREGSVQGIARIPPEVREIYRTAWEIKNRVIIDMTADRAPWVDQSQSTNYYIADGNYRALQSSQFYAWKRGLKTLMYYVHTRAGANGATFGVDISKTHAPPISQSAPAVCSRDNPHCESCSA